MPCRLSRSSFVVSKAVTAVAFDDDWWIGGGGLLQDVPPLPRPRWGARVIGLDSSILPSNQSSLGPKQQALRPALSCPPARRCFSSNSHHGAFKRMMCCALWSPECGGEGQSGPAFIMMLMTVVPNDRSVHGLWIWSHGNARQSRRDDRLVMCNVPPTHRANTHPQATSRQTRLRSEKYEKNVTKRGNVPVGKAAVRVRRMHACLCMKSVSVWKGNMWEVIEMLNSRRRIVRACTCSHATPGPTEAGRAAARESHAPGLLHLRRRGLGCADMSVIVGIYMHA